jgi:hypothetical protein
VSCAGVTHGTKGAHKPSSPEKYLLAPKLTPYDAFSLPKLDIPQTHHIVEKRSLDLVANYSSYAMGYKYNLQNVFCMQYNINETIV